MNKKINNKRFILIVILIVAINILIGIFFIPDYPSIVKAYLPARAEIISTKNIRRAKGRSSYEWVARHKAYFILDERKYTFYFMTNLTSYHIEVIRSIFFIIQKNPVQ